jgi:hypothetical protein
MDSKLDPLDSLQSGIGSAGFQYHNNVTGIFRVFLGGGGLTVGCVKGWGILEGEIEKASREQRGNWTPVWTSWPWWWGGYESCLNSSSVSPGSIDVTGQIFSKSLFHAALCVSALEGEGIGNSWEKATKKSAATPVSPEWPSGNCVQIVVRGQLTMNMQLLCELSQEGQDQSSSTPITLEVSGCWLRGRNWVLLHDGSYLEDLQGGHSKLTGWLWPCRPGSVEQRTFRSMSGLRRSCGIK